jgi:hypothetical protein
MAELPHVSFSRLSTYAECGQKFKLSYVDEVPREPQGAFIGGIAVHETVEDIELAGQARNPLFFVDDFIAPSQAATLFREKLMEGVGKVDDPDLIRWGGRKSKLFPNGHDLKWWTEFGPGMVMQFHRQRLADDRAGDEVLLEYVEAQVNGTWEKNTPVVTRLDAMVEGRDGRFWIRDYKTGQARKEQRLQQVLYCMMAEETLNIPIAGAELVYLATTALQVDRFEWQPYEAAIGLWVDEAIAGITSDVYPMSPSSYCTSCSVRSSCSYGRLLGGGEASG